jgi:ferredoxin-NADP reductase
MGFRERYRQLPRNPLRQERPDLMMGFAGAVIAGMDRVAGLTRRVSPPAELDRTRVLRVAERQVVAHDENVVALTFAADDGKPLPRWHPGSHIDVHLPSGLVRQYSLCGDPMSDDRYRIAVRRIPDGGGGSIEMHGLTTGDTITTHGPRNAFPLTVPGYGSPMRRIRFIAGGIGITPILPMLAMAQRLGVDWSMVYAGRSRDSLPFVDEVRRFAAGRAGNSAPVHIEVRTDDADGLPTATELLGDCQEGTAVYACGPVVEGKEFTVAVASATDTVRVGADETLLTALKRAGVHPPYSCQQGFCGTCRTRVLGVRDGTVEHRDTLLTDPERDSGMMLICVSRAAEGSHLTLDL